MSQPIPQDDLLPPRQDQPLIYGADLRFRLDCSDLDGQPWPFDLAQSAVIRIGSKAAPDHTLPCEIVGSSITVHVDHAVCDTIGRSVEYAVLVQTPTTGADPVLDDPWFHGLLKRVKLA